MRPRGIPAPRQRATPTYAYDKTQPARAAERTAAIDADLDATSHPTEGPAPMAHRTTSVAADLLLDTALKTALIHHTVECETLDANRANPHVWPDHSGIYRDTITLIKDLCAGRVAPADYLAQVTAADTDPEPPR